MGTATRGAVDCHVHLVGMDRDGNGCILAPRMRWRPSTRFILCLVGAKRGDPPSVVDRRCVDHLYAALDAAPSLGTAVLLAMDGVYGPDGRLDGDRTSVMVPNAYAARVAAGHPKLRWGAGINPARADALEELDRCAAAGAALVKWIPAAGGFDPADARHLPFYARLAALGMPLLSHVGTELAVATVDAALGEFARLRAPLDAGVTVIVAHAGGCRLLGDAADFERLRAEVEARPNLFLDDSALTLAHRRRRLFRLAGAPGLRSRVLHGSDYPLPAQAWAFADRIGFRAALRVGRIPSPFERDLALKEAVGVPDAFLENAARVLRPAAAPPTPPSTTRP
jgi:predicted TIM-barrel fold metal-dependent hydrolase